MRARHLRWGPALLTALTVGCGIFGPNDSPAGIDWVEAWFGGLNLEPIEPTLELRAVGTSGCGQLKSVETKVGPESVVLFARATESGGFCEQPLPYEDTVSIPLPDPWRGISVSAALDGNPSDAVELFSIPMAALGDAFAGGRAGVEGVDEGCPRIRLTESGWTFFVYPIEFPREVGVQDGDGLFLSGVFHEGHTSACYGGRVLSVQRVTLSFHRSP